MRVFPINKENDHNPGREESVSRSCSGRKTALSYPIQMQPILHAQLCGRKKQNKTKKHKRSFVNWGRQWCWKDVQGDLILFISILPLKTPYLSPFSRKLCVSVNIGPTVQLTSGQESSCLLTAQPLVEQRTFILSQLMEEGKGSGFSPGTKLIPTTTNLPLLLEPGSGASSVGTAWWMA